MSGHHIEIEVEDARPSLRTSKKARQRAIEELLKSGVQPFMLKGSLNYFYTQEEAEMLLKLAEGLAPEFYQDPVAKAGKKLNEIMKGRPEGKDPYETLFGERVSIFSSTTFSLDRPASKPISKYTLPDGSEVLIFSEGLRNTYFLIPSELSYTAEEIKNIKKEMESIRDGAAEKGSPVAMRHTYGFGVLDTLLQDKNIEDINFNGPGDFLRIVHSEFEECNSNIYVGRDDAESWATKLKISSRRSFDFINPTLDAALDSAARARVTFLRSPLSRDFAFSIRRHRDMPWTYPLLVEKKAFSTMAAAFFDLLLEQSKTMIIAGSRGAGKTSFLGASLFEIANKYRMIIIEDTMELPLESLRKNGYDVLHLKVKSPLSITEGEVTAENGLRSALRLGDSCLIIGEIRSTEARVLYEAMRVGALSNVVAGTVHAESPYGVFDRVVNELGVKPTSFKATDVIIITRPIKTFGLKKKRVVYSVVEVKKDWKDDPLGEDAFVELFRYEPSSDSLVATKHFDNADTPMLKSIRSSVKEWKDADQFSSHLKARASIKEEIIKKIPSFPEVGEASFIVEANNAYYQISSQLYAENGYPDSRELYKRFVLWLKGRLAK
ncbi:MAG: type II/IV secretion system ATPase subunit [Candidatus Anstonellales archaeon]